MCLLRFPSIHDELRHQTPSPIKESNLKEENCRKNYFPVPWRVIGGGVRVGITETEDSDLSYSTPNISRPPTSKFENDHDHDHDDTPTKILYRKRSNSNPPIPSPHSLQFKVEHVGPFFFIWCNSNLINFHTSLYNSYSLLNLPVCCDSPSLTTLFFVFVLLYFSTIFILYNNELFCFSMCPSCIIFAYQCFFIQ